MQKIPKHVIIIKIFTTISEEMAMNLTAEEELWLSQQEKPERKEDLQVATKSPMTHDSLKNPPKLSRVQLPTLPSIADQLGGQDCAPDETDPNDTDGQTITFINGQLQPLHGTRTIKRTLKGLAQ